MTTLILILTALNTINVIAPMPLWYRIAMLIFSVVVLAIAMKKRK